MKPEELRKKWKQQEINHQKEIGRLVADTQRIVKESLAPQNEQKKKDTE
jgi:hypothetical protein